MNESYGVISAISYAVIPAKAGTHLSSPADVEPGGWMGSRFRGNDELWGVGTMPYSACPAAQPLAQAHWKL
jgi:hypothetical protein